MHICQGRFLPTMLFNQHNDSAGAHPRRIALNGSGDNQQVSSTSKSESKQCNRLTRHTAVFTWHWNVANGETLCGICQAPFEMTCPTCHIPGDSCPLSKNE